MIMMTTKNTKPLV